MNKKTSVVLFCVICLGLFLRLYRLNSIPSGVDWDESSFGYNAYTIAKSGIDEWGNRFPLLFQAFGDSKLPTYIYLSSLVIRFAGLSVFTARLIPALLGTLSIWLIFFISDLLFKNKKVSLLSALLFSLSPFGIFYSRLALDIGVVNFFILGGILYELKYIDKRKQTYILLSTISLIIAFFSYNAGRIISPLLFFLFFMINAVILKERFSRYFLSFFLIVCTAVIGFMQLKQGALIRMRYMGIFGSQKSAQLQIDQLRSQDQNDLISKIAHNKLIFFSIQLVGNYANHFSTNTLGYESIPQAVQVAFHGPLYGIQLPFYYVGLYLLLRGLKNNDKKKQLSFLVILLWILISPLPSIITEGGISRRYLGALGSWELLTAYAFITFADGKKQFLPQKRILVVVCVILYFASCLSFLDTYFFAIPRTYTNVYFARQNKLAKQVLKENYDAIFISKKITAEPHIFLLFFGSYDPLLYQKAKRTENRENGISVTGYGHYYFPEEIDPDGLATILKDKGNVKIYLTSKEVDSCMTLIKRNHLEPKKVDASDRDTSQLFSIEL